MCVYTSFDIEFNKAHTHRKKGAFQKHVKTISGVEKRETSVDIVLANWTHSDNQISVNGRELRCPVSKPVTVMEQLASDATLKNCNVYIHTHEQGGSSTSGSSPSPRCNVNLSPRDILVWKGQSVHFYLCSAQSSK